MTVLPILHWPDTRLSQPCAPVDDGADVAALVADLFDTMYAAPGRGLAAPQVGVLRRVFVMDAGWKDGAPTPRACLNPQILHVGQTGAVGEEACLSVPGVTARVECPVEIVLGYTDPDGTACRETLTGAEARVALHEFDHLDGRMHFDRLDPAARDALLSAYAAQG